MKVSPSLALIKIVILLRVVLSEYWVILFGLRFDMVTFLWNCSGFFETVWHRLASFGIVWLGSI